MVQATGVMDAAFWSIAATAAAASALLWTGGPQPFLICLQYIGTTLPTKVHPSVDHRANDPKFEVLPEVFRRRIDPVHLINNVDHLKRRTVHTLSQRKPA